MKSPQFPLLFLLMLMVGGCEVQTDERVIDLVVPVTVQPVARGIIESFVSTTGSLRASRSADILVEVRGNLFYVEDVSGKKPVEGTRVDEGAQIARI